MKKAIIIAAGMGKRLKPLTNDMPKCLLKVGRKSILRNQISIYKSLGLKNINIICGHEKKRFEKKVANFFFNEKYRENNILESLFYAKKNINGNCLISYSDIIFKKKIIREILKSQSSISILTDVSWKKNYKKRYLHPMSEAEKVRIDRDDKLVTTGKNLNIKRTDAEFIGVLKLDSKGCKIFKKYYKIAKKNFSKKKFYNSRSITKAYITDFLNFLVYNNIEVKCIKINGGWMEIDTVEDFNKAQKFYN